MSLPAVISIDGPSASGKGTVAALVARALGFHYLESGALYRLVAFASQRAGIAENDEVALSGVAAGLPVRFEEGKILLQKEDVAEQLRSEDIGNLASAIARLPTVRTALLERQRAFRAPPGLVADGRDMATVVFPDSVLKVFLTASVAVRAERRYKQLNGKGNHANLASLSRDLAARDERDAKRAVAPLVPAPDAVQIDSSELSVDAVVARVLALAKARLESQ